MGVIVIFAQSVLSRRFYGERHLLITSPEKINKTNNLQWQLFFLSSCGIVLFIIVWHPGSICSTLRCYCYIRLPTSLYISGCFPYVSETPYSFPSALAHYYVFFTMLSVPSSESTSATTFSSKSAPRPRTIPLYATSIPGRTSRQISIHQTLPPRARYHPYAQERRLLPPIDTSSTSSGDSSIPDSPLTPIDPTASTAPNGSSRKVVAVQIPPPNKKVTVANAGWHADLVSRYRVAISAP